MLAVDTHLMNVVLAVGRESVKVGFPTGSPTILQASCRSEVRSIASRLSLTSAMPGVTKWSLSDLQSVAQTHTIWSIVSGWGSKVLVVLDAVEQLPDVFTFF